MGPVNDVIATEHHEAKVKWPMVQCVARQTRRVWLHPAVNDPMKWHTAFDAEAGEMKRRRGSPSLAAQLYQRIWQGIGGSRETDDKIVGITAAMDPARAGHFRQEFPNVDV